MNIKYLSRDLKIFKVVVLIVLTIKNWNGIVMCSYEFSLMKDSARNRSKQCDQGLLLAKTSNVISAVHS